MFGLCGSHLLLLRFQKSYPPWIAFFFFYPNPSRNFHTETQLIFVSIICEQKLEIIITIHHAAANNGGLQAIKSQKMSTNILELFRILANWRVFLGDILQYRKITENSKLICNGLGQNNIGYSEAFSEFLVL